MEIDGRRRTSHFERPEGCDVCLEWAKRRNRRWTVLNSIWKCQLNISRCKVSNSEEYTFADVNVSNSRRLGQHRLLHNFLKDALFKYGKVIERQIDISPYEIP